MCLSLCISVSVCVGGCVSVSVCLCVSGCVSFSLCLDSTWEETDRKPEWLGMVLCFGKMRVTAVASLEAGLSCGPCRHAQGSFSVSWWIFLTVHHWGLTSLTQGFSSWKSQKKSCISSNLDVPLRQGCSDCRMSLFEWETSEVKNQSVTEKESSRRSLKWNVLFLLWPPDAL